jgi:ubiquitin carboxyl-terminal hydrolase 6/32
LQVCHVALGLRPASRGDEGDIVRGWLEREERRGYRVGQFWYLVSIGWWRTWQDHTVQVVQVRALWRPSLWPFDMLLE